MIKVCKNCQKDFEHVGSTRGVFCSRQCYNEYRANGLFVQRKAVYLTLTCPHCEKEFQRREQEIKRQKSKFVYCSRQCAGADRYNSPTQKRRPSIVCICRHCGVEFKAKASEVEGRGRKYCSQKCACDAKKSTLTGDGNPNYRHGRNQGAANKTAKKHYNAECIICGFDVVVEVHHITPKSLGGTNDPLNLAVLCPNHHAMAGRGMIDSETLRSKARSALMNGPLCHKISTA